MKSIKELKKFCKYSDQEIWLRRVFDELSVPFTKLLLYTSVTANQVTLLAIFFGIIGVGLITFPNSLIHSLGFLFLYFYWILDLCDGQVARYRKATSLKGHYLDILGHFTVHPFIYLAVGVHLFNQSGEFLNLIIGVATSFLSIFYFVNHKVYSILKETERKHKEMKEKELKDKEITDNNQQKENNNNAKLDQSQKVQNEQTKFICFLKQVQKSLRFPTNVATYFLVANLGVYILLFFQITLNLVFYLLVFYLILYLALFTWQCVIYFKSLPTYLPKIEE
tara:strand:+ start:1719 stop:2558 length:840 start_codon:yes stop_codon:yes gene_type:complete